MTVLILALITILLIDGERDVRPYFFSFSGLYICWFAHLLYLYANERAKRRAAINTTIVETPSITEKVMLTVNCAITIVASIYSTVIIIVGDNEGSIRFLLFVGVAVGWFIFCYINILKNEIETGWVEWMQAKGGATRDSLAQLVGAYLVL